MLSSAPLSLYSRGRGPSYRLNGRLGGSENRSWCCEEDKHIALLGIEHWSVGIARSRTKATEFVSFVCPVSATAVCCQCELLTVAGIVIIIETRGEDPLVTTKAAIVLAAMVR
jgi:hypothetical protein